MVQMSIMPSREFWAAHRNEGLGGSDAAAIIGQSPFMSNVDLWEYKTGRRQAADISDRPVVKYGTEAERYIRGLFELDHPELKVEYRENNSWRNDRFPFALASLDGWLTDEQGRKGVLEIKTADILSFTQKQKWEGDRLPQNYFCQVLWYMGVLEADFAILRAHLKHYSMDCDCSIKEYRLERADVDADIRFLMSEGAKFWEYIQKDICPPLKINI